MSVSNCFVQLCIILVCLCVPCTLSEGYTCTQNGGGPSNMMMDNGAMNPKYMWYKRGGSVMVPIVLDRAYSHRERDIILGGLMDIESNTCVQFYVFNNTAKLMGYDYVHITRSKSKGCWSYVGRVGGGAQDLSLPQGCINHRTSIHEMIHALGFPHEHTRPDRDDYVHILWGNIMPGRERNFERKRSASYAFGPYDYDSIMHYDRRAFTFNGMDTIRPLKSGHRIGKLKRMSYGDMHKINAMYKCGSHRGTNSHHYPKYADSFPMFDDPHSYSEGPSGPHPLMTHMDEDSMNDPEYYEVDHSHRYSYLY